MKRWKWVKRHRMTIDRVTTALVTLSMVMSLMPGQGIAWAQEQANPQSVEATEEALSQDKLQDATQANPSAEQGTAPAESYELQDEAPASSTTTDTRITDYETPVAEQPSATDSYQVFEDMQTYQQVGMSDPVTYQDLVEYGNLKITMELLLAQTGYEFKDFSVTVQNARGEYLTDKGVWTRIIWPEDVKASEKDLLMPKEVKFAVSQANMLNVWNLPVGTYTIREVMDDTVAIEGYAFDAAASITKVKRVAVYAGQDSEVKLTNVYQQVVAPVEETPAETEVAPAPVEPTIVETDVAPIVEQTTPEATTEDETPAPEVEPEATIPAPETAVAEDEQVPAAEDEQAPADEGEQAPDGEVADETAEAAAPANTKTTFYYEDADVRVAAKLDDPSVLPAGVTFVVRPVTPASTDGNYLAYLKALNESVEGKNPYNNRNTLLYDVSFQVADENGETVEVEPAEGAVKVTFSFKNDQLTQELDAKNPADVEVIHLPETEAGIAAEAVDATAKSPSQIQMTVDSFSVYAFAYTVDFTYDGFTYSIAGESHILLSKLLAALSLDLNLDNVKSVSFSDPELVEVKQVEGDWLLTSLKPFRSEETLTVEMFSGATYVIQVTDAQDIVCSIEFLDRDGSAIAGMPDDVKSANPYIFAYLVDSDGNVVGSRSVPVDQNTCTATISGNFSSNLYNSDIDLTVAYDPAVHTLKTRVVKGSHSISQIFNTQWNGSAMAPVGEPHWNGYDQFDGYDFIQTNDPTTFKMQRGWKKTLAVELSYAGGDTGESAPGTIIVRAKAATTGWHYYKLPVDTISWNAQPTTHAINEWFKKDGSSFGVDDYSAAWTDVEAVLFAGDVSLPQAANQLENGSNGVPFLAGYQFMSGERETREGSVDESAGVQTVTLPVVLDGTPLDAALTPEGVLGDAYEFGIVADTYRQQGHTETNFAVKHYDHDSNFDIEGSNGPYSDMPFYAGEIANVFTAGQGTNADLYLYTPQREIDKGRISQSNIGKPKHGLNVIPTDIDEINEYVDGMIDAVRQKSAAMAQKTTIKPSGSRLVNGKVVIDTTAFPDNTTIYVDCSDITDQLASTDNVHIKKRDGQTIVMNVLNEGAVNIGKFTVFDDSHPSGVESTTQAKDRDNPHNLDVDAAIFEHVIFNMPNASTVHTDNASAMFLAPNAASFTQSNGAGWIVCGGTVDSGSEWHFYRHNRHFSSSVGSLQINKKLSGDVPEAAKTKTYKFYVYEETPDGRIYYFNNPNPPVEGEEYDPVVSSSEPVQLSLTGASSLKLKGLPLGRTLKVEEIRGSAAIGGYELEVTGESEKTIEGGRTKYVSITNTYEKAPEVETGELKITKTFGGDVTKEEVASGAITFEIKNAEGKWLKADGSLSDTKVELTLGEDDGFEASADGLTWTKTFAAVAVGTYTVTESNTAIIGYDLVEAESTVEVEDVAVSKSTVGSNAALAELEDVYARKTVDVAGTKIWADNDNEARKRTAITVKLQKKVGEGAWTDVEGKTKDIAADATGEDLAYSFTGLPEYEGQSKVEYQVVEAEVPQGYTVAGGTSAESYDLTNTIKGKQESDLPVDLVVEKQGAAGAKLPGATFTLTPTGETEGEDKTYTTGDAGTVTITFTTPGTWTLQETAAPEGYVLDGTKIYSIEVTRDGTANITYVNEGEGFWSWAYQLIFGEDKPTLTDGKLVVTDTQTSVSISKVDTGAGEELPGATLQLFDAAGNKVEEWVSGEAAHEIKGLKTGVEYTLKETTAPDGYTIATDTKFTIEADGTVKSGGTVVEGGHIMVEDAPTKVTISKTDMTGEEELDGAVLQILAENADGELEVVELDGEELEHTSKAGEPWVVEGLKTGVEYTLVETTAPDGYAVAAATKFTIGEDGKVTYGGTSVKDEDGNEILLVEDAPTKVTISKRDMTGGDDELPGATLQVLDASGALAKDLAGNELSWTSDTEPKVITGLKAGTYTLHEEAAPDGYAVATDTTFTIAADGTVTTTGNKTTDKDGNEILVVNDAPIVVKVSKVDIAGGEELPGATIQILDDKDAVVETWTSETDNAETTEVNEAIHEIAGLKPGVTYTLRETVAPDGYAITSDTTFTIDEAGKVTTTGSVTEDGVILIEDAKTTIKVSKVAAGAGTELPGATIQIKDSTGKVVAEWTSVVDDEDTENVNEAIHEVEGLTGDQLYTLVETVAPAGYTIATETTFFLNADGTIDANGTTAKVSEEGVLLIEDDMTKVLVSKRAITGGDEELAGAQMKIIYRDDEGQEREFTHWTSGDAPHEVTGLVAGVEYMLVETVAPDGYAVATVTKFTVDEHGEVTTTGKTTTDTDGNTVILVEDAKTSVSVSKVAVGGGEEIAGAQIQVLDKDGAVVQLNGQPVEWTSEAGKTHEIVGLKTGVTYTLRETIAPDGYAIATDIEFTLNADGSVTTSAKRSDSGAILIEDALTKVTISKKAVGGEDELPGATLQVLDDTGALAKDLEGNELEWVSTDEPKVIEGLKTGVEYTLKETVAPDGYSVASEIKFTIEADGTVKAGDKEVEGNVLLVEDAPTSVTVSKKAVGGEDELPGATLQVLDDTGALAKDLEGNELEWVSADEPKVVTGLKTGVTYTLKETVAPEGYAVATDTTFTIDETGKVTTTGKTTTDKDGNAILLVEDDVFRVKVSKVDVAGGEELPGATIQILDDKGAEVETWTSEADNAETTEVNEAIHEIAGLKPGVTYTLRETVAPDGYAVATDTTFTIDEHGKVTTTGSVTEDGVILINDAKTKVTISKVDVDGGAEIAGAKLQVLDADGNVVEVNGEKVEWTSTTEPHEIEGLKTGVTYTLHEDLAPTGYQVATDTTFTIEADGTVKVISGSSKDVDGKTVLLVEDAKTLIKVSKVETGAGEELAGAHIQIINPEGAIVAEWDSLADDEATADVNEGIHEVEGLETGVEYTLRETTAPDGYTIAAETKFTIDEKGKVTGSATVTEDGVILVEDAPTKVLVSKVETGAGEELPGARLQVLDADGNVVELNGERVEWTSGTEPHLIEGLKAGVEYTLRETTAPDGYTITSDTKFTIAPDGKVTGTGTVTTGEGGVPMVVVEDAPTKVLVSKVETGAGEELPGAHIQILAENAEGELEVVEIDGKPVEWVSGEEPHEVLGLKAGVEYTLRETTAPDGYTIAANTKFTIDETGKVTGTGTVTTGEGGVPMVVIEDAPTKVTISKTDMTGEEELDGAVLQILGEDGKVVKQGEDELVHTSKAGEPWVVTGLKTGVTYTLRETTAPDGYSITADTTFSIDETGKVTYGGTIAKDEDGNDILLVKDEPLGGPTRVIISKTDITGEQELAGATLEIRDADGKVVEVDGKKLTWTSNGSERWFVEGLEAGVTYTLVETTAPDGYTIAAATTFTIGEDGTVTSSGTVTEEGVILVEDAPTKVKVSKTDTGAGEELPGATIQILAENADGELEVVEIDGERVEWVSTTEPHLIEGLKTGVEYTLRETTAPVGYTIASDTTFTIDEKGKVTTTGNVTTGEDGVPVLMVEDAPIKVKVSKTEITGGDEELAGAELRIIFRDDTGQERTLDEWTSGDAPHEVAGLMVGVEYTLVETVAPDGYTVATATKFTVGKDGKVTTEGSTTTDSDGFTVILVEDAKTSVKISKVDTGAGEELPGATIQILAENAEGKLKVVEIDGKPVEWVSGDKPHEVVGLKTGVEYTLRETTAPDGYTIATDTTFTIAPDGTVKGNGSTTTDEDGNTVLLVEDAPTKVTISKTDMTGEEELDGAVLQILAENADGELEVVELNGKELKHTSKKGEPWTVEGLTAGVEYTIRETTAPDGYTITSDTKFTIDENGTVTGSATVTEDGVILVEDAPTKVLVSKVETGAGEELPGAKLQVLDADGNVVKIDGKPVEWVSTTEPHLIEGLKTGVEYTLRETTAPDGYTVTSDTKFTIDETGKVTGTGTVTTGEGGVPMVVVEDAPTKVTVSKTAVGAGEELPGATIQILDEQGEVVEEWVSGDKPHEVTKLKTGVEYTLRETVAPDGYDIATDTTFTIDETGKVTTTGTMTEGGAILIEDALKGEGPTKVIISKTDITGEQELAGATLEIRDADGKVVEVDGKKLVWTSTGSERWLVEGLEKGVEYTLHETTAPDGYTIAADTTFTIGEDGTVTSSGTVTDAGVILVEDASTKVALSKTDMTGDVELDGAVLQILGEDGEVVTLNGEKLEHTSKAGEPWIVEGLTAGVEYTIRETTAPDGYTIATDTTFTINEDGTVDYGGPTSTTEDGTTILLVEDAPTKVTISKVATGAGEELPGATLQVLAENADGELEVVELNGEKLEWVSGDEPKVIEGLSAGVEYTLRETTAPDGYTIATDTTFTIAKDGKVTSTGSTTTNDKGETVLLVEDEPTKIKVSKVETGAGEELPGATIQILAENAEGELEVVEIDGKPVEWVSGDKPHEVVGLKTGVEYTLRETVAPAGYAVATDTTFTIDETGKVEATGSTTTDEDGNTVLLIEDDRISVRVSKVETGAGEEVPGAKLQVIDEDGTVVDEWVSGDAPHDIVGLQPGVEYTLRETVAPEGYTVATDTTFSIDEEGKVTTTGSKTTDKDGNTVLLVEDDRTSVKVSKTDITGGEELAGAKIQILDETGKVVEEWTSVKDDASTTDVNEAIHEIVGLKTGVTYTLRETVAPAGYDIATDTTFTIDEAGKVTTTGTMTEDGVILIEDALLGGPGKVIISKTDIGGEKELAGATLEIRDASGEVVEVDGKKLTWTSKGGERWFVEGLEAGVEYQLVETVAPDGYLITSAITFSLDEDGTVTAGGKVVEGGHILVEDAPTKVAISKVATGAGEELPGATLQVLAKNEDGELEVVESDGEKLEWVSGEEPKLIEGLSVGVEYTLRETTAPEGYTIATDTTFTINEDGTVEGKGSTTTTEDGTTVLLVEDAPTKVTISKTDMTGKTELDGAVLQILAKNADGELEVVELNGKELKHTSKAGEPWVVEGLPTGVTYTLRETTAPDGFTVAEDTTFTIDETGKVTYSGTIAKDEDGNEILLVEDAPTKVTISKTDMAGEEELDGAKLEIRDKDGNVVTLNGTELKHTSEAGKPWVVEGLTAGVEYTLVETTAPDGYTIAAETTFTIAPDGKVTGSGTVVTDEDGNEILLVEDAPTKVTVSKTAVGAGEELPGATIQILEDGKIAKDLAGKDVEWVSGGTPHEVIGLKTGVTYTLKETVAPDGYAIATETTFTINDDGTVTTTGSITEDGILLINDALTSVSISKVDVDGGAEIAGAKLQVLGEDGEVATTATGEKAEWTSTTKPHVIEGLATGVTYTLHEDLAPAGYTVATDTTFTIDADGTVKVISASSKDEDGKTVLLVEDAQTAVRVSKTDVTGEEELPGAHIQILDADGGVADEWTSVADDAATADINEAIHVTLGLTTGVTYTLKETVAPDGYAIATETTFTIVETGKVTTTGSTTTDAAGNTVILIKDALTTLTVSKTAIAGSAEIPGAELQIMDADATAVVTLADGSEAKWTSTDKPHEVCGLKAGETYVLRETVAPNGYAIATDITFTLDEAGAVSIKGTKVEGNHILVEDALTEVRVSKTAIAGGEELPGATLQVIKKDASGIEDIVKSWTSGTTPELIQGLVANTEYILRETVAPAGYAVTTDITFTVDGHNKVTTSGSKTTDADGNDVLLVEDALTKLTVSKTDITGEEEIAGATIQILDADENVVELGGKKVEWTSGDAPHEVTGLATGVTYILRETVAPDGYTIASDTTFTINARGEVVVEGQKVEDNHLLVKDDLTSIKVSKTDIGGENELAGATIQILDADGKVVEINGEKVEWVSGEEPHEVTGLTTGVTYTLRETVAPDGYTIAADTTFSIAADGTVTSSGTVTEDGVILIEDAPLVGEATISLTKEMKANAPYTAEESFTFTLAAEDGTKLGELSLKAGETASFDSIAIAKEGTTYYTITETAGTTPHVTYDTAPKWAKVTATAGPEAGLYDVKVTYGASKDACTEEKLTIENIYAVPALEKYINKDVHQDLPAFDTPFVYDILAFVTNDADSVVITDPLVKGIRFLKGTSTTVTVQDIGEENDHKAHGTVEQATGTDLEATCTIDDDPTSEGGEGRSLTVTIDNAKAQGVRGHWVRVTYQVALDNEVVGVEDEYVANDEEVLDNDTVISEAYPDHHDGVKTGASYIVYAENGETYDEYANDITVTPPIEPIAVSKKWVDANGKTVDWPKGAKVTVELLGNGKSLDKATAEVLGEGRALDKAVVVLSEDSPTGAFVGVPIYEAITYTVAETKVTGVSEGFTAVCAGGPAEGFEVTNTFDDKKPSDEKPTDDDKKPSDDDKKPSKDDNKDKSKDNNKDKNKKTTNDDKKSGSTTSKTVSTVTGVTPSGTSLAKTDDLFAGSESLIAILVGMGGALVLCGALARRRRREDA